MKFPILSSVFAGALVASGLVSVLTMRTARAFQTLGDCNFSPIKLSVNLEETRNGCSISTGSQQASAYFAAINQWFPISNRFIGASFVRDPSDCTITFGDGASEVARVPRSAIGGNNGLTEYSGEDICLLPPGPGNYSEADALIADDLNYSLVIPGDRGMARPPAANPTSPQGGGAMTFLHEMGHQLALADSSALNVMTVTSNRAVRPKWTNGALSGQPAPMADEAMGLGRIYGSKPVVNLFPIAERLSANAVVDIQTADIAACRGGNFTVRLTTVNVSHVAATFRQRLFAGTTRLFELTNRTVAAQSSETVVVQSVVPATLVNGGYILKHVVDTASAVSEGDESDNAVTYRGVLVISC
jgi:hypothetical protein